MSNGEFIPPVSPHPSPEAAQLLRFLQDISGKRTLAGQHCAPLLGSTRLGGMHKLIGRYPAVFGQDFGFSAPGTWDGINFRQRIVDEAIRRQSEGFIITLMWHAVRPLDDEPVVFEESIEGRLTDGEWRDLLTPGTPIHERWKSQVDVIAWFLRQLREAGVPVLWRPYHEMNGDWFWWCGRKGEGGYRRLYRMLFERLTVYHGLNNLLWVFNANEVRGARGTVRGVLSRRRRGRYPRHGRLPGRVRAGGLRAIARLSPPENRSRWGKWADCRRRKSSAASRAGRGSCIGAIRWRFGRSVRPFGNFYENEPVMTWEELPWVKTPRPRIHDPIIK